MLYGLLLLSVIIAVLGIINTLALSVFERTREIGLLRAVGHEPSPARGRMITIESVATAVFGAVLGTGARAGLGIAVQRAGCAPGAGGAGGPVAAMIGVVLGRRRRSACVAAVLPASAGGPAGRAAGDHDGVSAHDPVHRSEPGRAGYEAGERVGASPAGVARARAAIRHQVLRRRAPAPRPPRPRRRRSGCPRSPGSRRRDAEPPRAASGRARGAACRGSPRRR